MATLYLPAYMPGTADLADVRARVAPALEAELAEAGMQLGSPIHIRIFKEFSELEL